MKNTFALPDPKDRQLHRWSVVMTLYCLALLAGRWMQSGADEWTALPVAELTSHRGHPTFLFLPWNLFLAWIPYWFSTALRKTATGRTEWGVQGAVFLAWMLFFPNAPYLITDLLHLRARTDAPYWYDLMLLLSFAMAGLILGLLSLREIHRWLRRWLPPPLEWPAIALLLAAGSYGIFIGRFLRFNSWDLLIDPLDIGRGLLHPLLAPGRYESTLGLFPVLTVFLGLIYFLFHLLLEKE